MKQRSNAFCATAAAILWTAAPAIAGGTHAASHGYGFGNPAKSAEGARVIHVWMTDNAYEPETLEVAEGETIRFVIENAGEFVHEFALGTRKMNEGHSAEMLMMMETGMLGADTVNGKMDHDDPNSLLLEPGKTGELVWTFSGPTTIEFVCNVPGHYESGMVGPLTIRHGDDHGHGENS